jgi:hypothetical protein
MNLTGLHALVDRGSDVRIDKATAARNLRVAPDPLELIRRAALALFVGSHGTLVHVMSC